MGQTNRCAQFYRTALKHFCTQTTVPEHGDEAAGPQLCLHARARMAKLRGLEQGVTYPKPLTAQGIEVQAGNYNITAESRGIEMRYPKLCCNLANELPRDQRDLPTGTGGFGRAVVPLKPQIRDRSNAGLWLQGLPASGPNANPFHTALPNRAEIPIQGVFALRHDQFPPLKDLGAIHRTNLA